MVELSDSTFQAERERESEVTSRDDEAQQLRFGLSLTTLAAPSHMNYIMFKQ